MAGRGLPGAQGGQWGRTWGRGWFRKLMPWLSTSGGKPSCELAEVGFLFSPLSVSLVELPKNFQIP